MSAVARSGSTELSGGDWFLVTLSRMMRAAGQGEHVGLSVLELGPGLDSEALRRASARLAAVSPVAIGRLHSVLFGTPRWLWRPGDVVEFPLCQHPPGVNWETVASRRLSGEVPAPVSFDLIPTERGAMLLLQWRHSLLDGRGAELFLAEIARLAGDPKAETRAGSWGDPAPRTRGWRAVLGEAERFKNYYYARARLGIRALGDARPRPGTARFHVERFSAAETGQILARAAAVSRGLFQVGWFLAATMRAHRRVLASRGERAESYQSSCAVQERKRGARHPIWQNHVAHFFFGLADEQLGELAAAARLLQEQFADMSRQRLETAFAAMARMFRHVPSWYWLRILRHSSGGFITSFFFSHTGDFLPELERFCGAPIEHAWHIPSVSQPPGTGLFFGQHDGRLTATFSWREGVLRPGEFELMRSQLREDLLGP